MIKQFFLALLVTLMVNVVFAQKPTCKGGISWGDPGKNCSASGICFWGAESANNTTPVTATITENGKVSALKLSFDKKKAMSTPNGKAIFSGNSFTLEQPYRLPDEVCKQLKLRSGATLQKGIHPINPDPVNGKFSITFTFEW